jgi:hypothetical protein
VVSAPAPQLLAAAADVGVVTDPVPALVATFAAVCLGGAMLVVAVPQRAAVRLRARYRRR